ncbi:uncharacterized protein AB675_7954 [Cyphellophora attinorum]|uniref:Clr5 domain-containing protein n=1 Tax=Cyphellophora attinorum TaxID=1664694 RepID=A0A0N1HB27_9EURO|nr:uncharacterized protein AB675_7954 [Phialophora attinorum]KPI41182.1 hypothetical protein AB675_7954 [Phialophora attinorum]
MAHTALSVEARPLADGLISYQEPHHLPVGTYFALSPPVETRIWEDVRLQQQCLPAPAHRQFVRQAAYSGGHKGRGIGQETWNIWKHDVYDRYIIRDQTLKQIMDHYKRQKEFHGTQKQWKDQLGKWQFRKRLNSEDAAYICHQLRRGESDGRPRQVLFNGQPKTMDDIYAYIRKSTKVKSEAELMECLNIDQPPPHIVCEDLVPSGAEDLRSAGATTISPVVIPVHVSPLHSGDQESSKPRISEESFTHITAPDLDDFRAPSSGTSRSEENGIASEEVISDSDSEFHVPQIYSECGDGVLEMSSQESIPRMAALISNSPIQTDADPASIEVEIDEWLGKSTRDTIGDDEASRQRAFKFLRHCCAVAIHTGQTSKIFTEYAQRASIQAVAVFGDIFRLHPWDGVSVLNHMVALLSIYGHEFVPADILRNIRNDLHNTIRNRSSLDQQAPYVSVILSTLDFFSQIPYSKQIEPSYRLTDLAEMVDSAKKAFTPGTHDQFWLSTTYLHAWALLEMRENNEAYKILRDLRPEVEEVFGRSKFQTINWIATLARAESAIGKKTAAMNTYRDLFEARISPQFSDMHAQYWDGQYRLACYTRKHVDAARWSEEQKRVARMDIADRLQATLRWRAEHLGPHNPVSLQNERALRNVLKKLGLVGEDPTYTEIVKKNLTGL